MTNSEKKKLEDSLNQLYADAGNDGLQLTGTFDLLASVEDLGADELEQLEIHDYEADMDKALSEGVETVDHLANLYLNGNLELINHPYIKKKRQYDAANQADMLFIQKMAKKALIMQLKQMDMGDTTPRHYETFYHGLSQMRDNIKHSASALNTMEEFYKTLRKDLGIAEGALETNAELPEETTNSIFNPNDFNKELEEHMAQMEIAKNAIAAATKR